MPRRTARAAASTRDPYAVHIPWPEQGRIPLPHGRGRGDWTTGGPLQILAICKVKKKKERREEEEIRGGWRKKKMSPISSIVTATLIHVSRTRYLVPQPRPGGACLPLLHGVQLSKSPSGCSQSKTADGR